MYDCHYYSAMEELCDNVALDIQLLPLAIPNSVCVELKKVAIDIAADECACYYLHAFTLSQ